MNKVIKLVKCVCGLISGYLLIPGVYLGFVLVTNSTKGWNVKNDDGLLLVPIGLMILIISALIIIFNIICFIAGIKNKSRIQYLFVGLYLLGIIIYLLTWYYS